MVGSKSCFWDKRFLEVSNNTIKINVFKNFSNIEMAGEANFFNPFIFSMCFISYCHQKAFEKKNFFDGSKSVHNELCLISPNSNNTSKVDRDDPSWLFIDIIARTEENCCFP